MQLSDHDVHGRIADEMYGQKLADELIELPEKTSLLVQVISHINWTQPQRLRRSC